MFSYFGSKSKIVGKYPQPIYDTIIEPFAGSARYALKYFDRKVILVEKYEKVYKVWKYLQGASERDILSLPDIQPKQKLSDVVGYSQLSDDEKYLIGFCVNRGSRNTPKTYAGSFCNWNKDKLRISNNLKKIRHWDIRFGDYQQLENQVVTWFIDPPYKDAGIIYPEKISDYDSLSLWCKSRSGQVIVCENVGATWLDFLPIAEYKGQYKTSKEGMWYKVDVCYKEIR